MSDYKATFKCTIMTPEALLYQNEVESAFFNGDRGEFEILPYHYPILAILQEGPIILNWKESVTIKFGLIKFFANECVVLVEELERLKPQTKKKEVEDAIDTSE